MWWCAINRRYLSNPKCYGTNSRIHEIHHVQHLLYQFPCKTQLMRKFFQKMSQIRISGASFVMETFLQIAKAKCGWCVCLATFGHTKPVPVQSENYACNFCHWQYCVNYVCSFINNIISWLFYCFKSEKCSSITFVPFLYLGWNVPFLVFFCLLNLYLPIFSVNKFVFFLYSRHIFKYIPHPDSTLFHITLLFHITIHFSYFEQRNSKIKISKKVTLSDKQLNPRTIHLLPVKLEGQLTIFNTFLQFNINAILHLPRLLYYIFARRNSLL